MIGFGDAFKGLRKAVGMTQTEMADKLRLSQSTVAAWERGARLPDDFDDLEEALQKASKQYSLKVTRVQVAELRKKYEQDSDLPRVTDDAGEAICLREQQEYLSNAGHHNVSIWLIGPRTLPVLKSERVQRLWVENLRKGTAYCVLWLLDLVDSNTFSDLCPVLSKIGCQVRTPVQQPDDSSDPKGSSINHYASIGTTKSHRIHERLRAYRMLKERRLPGNHVHEARSVQVCTPIHDEFYNPLGSVILYRAHGVLGMMPRVVATLTDFQKSPESKPLIMYGFAPKNLTARLNKLVETFLEELPAAKLLDDE